MPTSNIFSKTTIGDIVSKFPDIISVTKSDTVGSSLKLLKEKDINALGVFDNHHDCFIGLVTVFDIMTYISFGAYKIDATPDTIEVGKALDTLIGDVTGVFHEETNKVWNFNADLPLEKLLEPMSKGVHRVVINMPDGSFKLISQHDIVNFALDNCNSFPLTFTSKTLEELDIGDPSITHVCSVSNQKSALHAFRTMEKVNHSALPVIDSDSGSIIATISSSDIRSVELDNINILLKSSIDFLKCIYSDNIEKPLTCTRTDTAVDIMKKLVQNHHKHVWVVDSENRPVSSVSLSDIITKMQE